LEKSYREKQQSDSSAHEESIWRFDESSTGHGVVSISNIYIFLTKQDFNEGDLALEAF